MPLERLNDAQMQILLEFAGRCRHLCFGRIRKDKDTDMIAYKEWKELSRQLNDAGNLPAKSGKEWKMYWTKLKTRTKGKLGNAKRKSKHTGAPLKLNLNVWEQRILQLAERTAKEGALMHNESTDTTGSIPDDYCEPKFESTPNTSHNFMNNVNPQVQVVPLNMSVLTQPAQHIANSTQAGFQSPTITAANQPMYPPHQYIPEQHTHPNNYQAGPQEPSSTEAGDLPETMLSPLAQAVLALAQAVQVLAQALAAPARASMSIADALRALNTKITNNHKQ